MKATVLFATVVVILSGCCEKTDIQKEKRDLLEADRRFSSVSVESGAPEAFRRFMADSATILRDGAHPFTGLAAIKELWSAWPTSATLEWDPVFVEVSQSGDLGYTIGKYRYTNLDSLGNQIGNSGYYVTIWAKQADGSWKWIFDTGTQGLPQEEK